MQKASLRLIFSLVLISLSLIGLLTSVFAYFKSNDLVLAQLQNQNSDELLDKEFQYSFPRDKDFFEIAYKFVKIKQPASTEAVVAGIIPHHLLAADLIANFFYNLEGQDFDTVILIGPNHFLAGNSDMISSAYDWQTPYGVLAYDSQTAKRLTQSNDIAIDEEAIRNEHAIFSEVSFIKKTFPKAKFLPIILKPTVDAQSASQLAQSLYDLSQDKKILVLASVDFSHYQTSQEAQKDDKLSIATINNFDFDNIYNIAVDSPASIYTILKFAQLSGKSFNLLDNSNSAILADKPDLDSTTSYVTGFFSSNKIISQRPIKMLFTGDLMLDRYVKTLIDQKGLDYIFGNLVADDFFVGYDLVSANLEGAVTSSGAHYDPIKNYDFAFAPNIVSQLDKYFTFFNLANNHLADQGQKGLEETRNNLSQLDFDFSGCQDGQVADCSATVLSVEGRSVAMIGLSTVGSKIDMTKASELIKALKEQAELVVVNVHWGEEYQLDYNSSQQKMAHQLIDVGSDVIIGHHPHVVQGVEIYKDRPIFYSLGNFVFDQYFSEDTQKELAVAVTWQDNQIDYELYHIKSVNGQLQLVAD
ncbi:AmmeMemoRadiSam system protein B [Patescibacteria group bacterium]|nr:AmmeMemoRadiSam system protein B [Patescibacteria group bacterium]